jgi:hypothetical protein
LFDEIQLAVIFRIKITEVAVGLDEFLKLGLLIDEIGLWKKKPPTAAISAS